MEAKREESGRVRRQEEAGVRENENFVLLLSSVPDDTAPPTHQLPINRICTVSYSSCLDHLPSLYLSNSGSC
eukprot:747254-Hanusia_phi.AAC.9